MADSDKNIIITPNRGATSQPTVRFTGQGNDPITLRVLDGTTGTGITAGGAISFEGSAGQLFSVVNRLGTGSIFSVNDISGIPSIDVDASGRIQLAGFTGNVGIGLTAPAEKLHVLGNMRLSGGLSAASATFSNDIIVNGVRVGEGGGSVATNVAVGQSALNANTTGARNVAVGAETLTAGATTSDVTAVGYRALYLNVGDNNTSIGSRALDANTTGIRNTAVGDRALTDQTTGSNNTGVGFGAISANVSGSLNTAVGDQAATTGTTASNVTAVGYRALFLNTASENSAIGGQCLYNNTTGKENTGVGFAAAYENRTGNLNTAIGNQALYGNTSGSNNVAVGYQAAFTGTTASNVTAVGYRALYLNTQSNNTAIGSGALDANTTGLENTAVGYNALGANTTGIYNTALGAYALRDNTTGEYNTSVGFESSRNGTTGSFNTNVGAYAGWLAFGNENTLIGSFALGGGATSGTNKATVIGTEALYPTYNASSTVAIGYRAGRFYGGLNNVRSAQTSVFIGTETRPNNDNQTNQIVIGYNNDGDGSNTTVIGNSSTTSTRVFGTFSTNGGLSAAGGTFSGIVNCLAGMCVAAGITLSLPAGTRTHISQQGIRGSGFKIRNQVSFGFGSGDANEIDVGVSGGNITLAPTTSTVTIDTGLANKSSVNYTTGIRFLGYSNDLSTSFNTILQLGVGQGNTLALPSGTGTLALTNGVVTTFNGLTGAVTGVTTGVANTFTALQSFNSGLSAGTGVTFGSNIAVNGGSITTTSTTANVFNTTATTLNIGGASTVTTIAGVASGLTLDIANTTHFSGQKNINIATNVSGGGTQRIAIGQGGGSIVSSTGGLTFGSSAGSSITNVLGSSCNIAPLTTFSNGISASGGITFNSPISSTRLPRFTSAALETKTANFSPTDADNGKVFVINHSSKTPVTVTLDGLSTGWRAKFISVNSGLVGFSSSLGTVYGAYGANGGNSQVSLFDPMVEVICYGTNTYFAG